MWRQNPFYVKTDNPVYWDTYLCNQLHRRFLLNLQITTKNVIGIEGKLKYHPAIEGKHTHKNRKSNIWFNPP